MYTVPGHWLDEDLSSMTRIFSFPGAIFAFLGVAAGAFGAHSLRAVLTADMLAVFETAARYQMYHALALLIIGGMSERVGSRRFRLASWCFVLGIVLFSGSLYALAFSGTRWIGAVTPCRRNCISGWVGPLRLGLL